MILALQIFLVSSFFSSVYNSRRTSNLEFTICAILDDKLFILVSCSLPMELDVIVQF